MKTSALTCFSNPRRFFDAVAPVLAAREIENGMLLGAASAMTENRGDALLAALMTNRAPVVAALQVRPYDLMISAAEPADLERLADELCGIGEPLPGVVGVEAAACCFAARWTAHTRQHQQLQAGMIFYTLNKLAPPARSPGGALRPATADDADWLTAWHVAFAEEAALSEAERNPGYATTIVHRCIDKGLQFVWEDQGRPVAMVEWRRTGLNGARIMGVMTDPPRRRNGYASAAVATLADRLLASGRSWCGLFADVANPQSNRIYQRLGFEEACRFQSIRFVPAARQETAL